jgi:hypothetical protein
VAFAIVAATALVITPGLRDIFGNAIPSVEQVCIILPFPVIIWGSDELRKMVVRRYDRRTRTSRPARMPS